MSIIPGAMDFFISRTDTIECYEITRCDWDNKGSIAKYMLTGFAGGLGLSGNGCGALAAAMWMKTLREVRNLN